MSVDVSRDGFDDESSLVLVQQLDRFKVNISFEIYHLLVLSLGLLQDGHAKSKRRQSFRETELVEILRKFGIDFDEVISDGSTELFNAILEQLRLIVLFRFRFAFLFRVAIELSLNLVVFLLVALVALGSCFTFLELLQ